jgi:uncharacterized phage-like protein YoqJ
MPNVQLDLKPESTLCFSGHRPNNLGGYYGPKARAIQSGIHSKLYELAKRAHEGGFRTFIQGGAQGVDWIAAEACIRLRREGHNLRLITAKPFPSQAAKWPNVVMDRYNNILEQSDAVINVSDDPFTAVKMFDRNMWMIDRSRVLIAVFGGKSGGTLQAISYARRKGLLICSIDPIHLEENWERPERR